MQGKAIDAHFLDVSTGAHPRHRHARAGGRRRLLSDRQHPLGAYRQRLGPILAAHEPRRADAAFPGRKDGVHPRRRPADAGLSSRRGPRSKRAAEMCRWRAAAALAGSSPGCSAAAAPTTPRSQAARKRRPRWRRPATRAAVEGGGSASRRSRSPTSGRRRSPRPSATCRPVPPTPDAAEPAPRRQAAGAADSGPEAVAKAKRNLPTGPAYASAAEPAPTPPVKPQAVAELEQPDVASDASPDEPRSSAGPKFIAPLPPRRPADLARPRIRRRPHASGSSGGSDPCLGHRPDRRRPSARRRTRGLARPRSTGCCRRLLPPASTARRPARWRWPKGFAADDI